MKYIKIYYRLLVYLTSLTVFSGDIIKKKKKKALKKKNKESSENDWSFSELFYLFFFFVPSTLNLKKNPVNQLIKKFWPKRPFQKTNRTVPGKCATQVLKGLMNA